MITATVLFTLCVVLATLVFLAEAQVSKLEQELVARDAKLAALMTEVSRPDGPLTQVAGSEEDILNHAPDSSTRCSLCGAVEGCLCDDCIRQVAAAYGHMCISPHDVRDAQRRNKQ